MGPLNGPAFIFAVFLCLKTGYGAYTEAVAASGDVSREVEFVPEVAFQCDNNRVPMHRVVNGWEADFKVDIDWICSKNLNIILEYCKMVYPDHQITNIMEREDKEVVIPNWPKVDDSIKDKADKNKVKSYKCLVGDFSSDALLVPQHCVFDHMHYPKRCEEPAVWKEAASDNCKNRSLELKSFGMLVVCGTDTFSGVEYVCCPKAAPKTQQVPGKNASESTSQQQPDEPSDDYMSYLQGDDMNKYENEHKKFRAAERAMQKHQHEKVTKMMKEWQKARDTVANMRKTNKEEAEKMNHDITEQFQRMYHAYEQEGKSEKKQLVSLHQQRVQAMFNRKKRVLMQEYKEELESDEPKTANLLSSLQQYIRVEEKDRLHTVNHYEHLRDTDPEEALRIRDSCIKHLELITRRIEDAIDMLKRAPEIDEKIRPQIAEFRNKKFRNLEISSNEVVMKPIIPQIKEDAVEVLPVDMMVDSSEEDSQGRDYTNIQIDSEEGGVAIDVNKPYIANVQNSGAEVQQQTFKSHSGAMAYSATNVVGIAIGSVAVLIIIVVAVVMVRKRSRRQPITHGFVEVDPAASPEERHVANMQMNGYENPTYRYFELGTK